MRGLNPEDAEEDQEDEEIVDRERLFERVSGEVLQGAGGAHAEAQEEGESQGGCDPECGSGDGGAEGIAMQPDLAASVNQLDCKQEQEREVKADPVRDGRCGHVTMLSRVRTVYIPPFPPQPASWPGTPFAKARRMGHPRLWGWSRVGHPPCSATALRGL